MVVRVHHLLCNMTGNYVGLSLAHILSEYEEDRQPLADRLTARCKYASQSIKQAICRAVLAGHSATTNPKRCNDPGLLGKFFTWIHVVATLLPPGRNNLPVGGHESPDGGDCTALDMNLSSNVSHTFEGQNRSNQSPPAMLPAISVGHMIGTTRRHEHR